MSFWKIRTRSFVKEALQRCVAIRTSPQRLVGHALLLLFATVIANGQTVTFNAPFNSISQTQVTYGQGIVADAESNLYITGTVNLLYLQRNANGSYTPAATKIDSAGGTAYGLAIDASNNLYRPDIAPNSYPALAKYTYQGVNSFQKSSIGTWSTSNRLSSVAVDSSYKVYVLDAGGSGVSTGSIVQLTPSSSCSSLSTCTTYTQTTLVTDPRLYSATGLSIDANGNFYFTSGSTTGATPTVVSSSTAAVYKLIPNGGTYAFHSLGSNWNSPAATAVDSLGNVWVADYGAQKIYELVPASSSASETSYTVTQFQSSTTFACLRTLTVSKTGQLFGLESGGSGCNSSAVPEVGGTPPHNAGTPSVGTPGTQEIDVTFSAPQNAVNYRVVTQGSTGTGGFSDVTPSTGSTSGGTPYCTQGTGSGYSCAILAQFYPHTPGLEEGAVLVLNSSGAVIGTNYLYGVGYGSQPVFAPGQTTTYAASQLLSPAALAMDAFSNLYAADRSANFVRLINSGGTAAILAGTGVASTSADASCGAGGLASTTNLTISGLALDGAGNLYLADSNQNRVCAMNLSTGVLSTVAGTGATCSSSTAACGDGGAATSAQLALGSASGLAVDGLGNLLIADSGDNRLRSVNLNTGVITTVAGTGGACSGTAACGDGGLATAAGAQLNNPTAIAVNASGDYLIADTGDNRVRRVSELTSALSTVAGSGTAGSSGDGALATSAQLSSPTGVAVDAAGDLYIADQGNNRVRMVTAGNGNIATLVGGGIIPSSSNPTSANTASLNGPAGVALDGSGNLYIADTGDSIIEKVTTGSITLNFPAVTTPGAVDSVDGVQTALLLNIGNQTLAHVSPGITTPTDFQKLTGTANDCSSTFSLASGTSCQARIEFFPQTPGSFNESLVFTDNALGASSTTQSVTLIGTAGALTITLSPSGALPAAHVGTPYGQTFTASGGVPPYTYAVSSGALPAGLTLSAGGVLSGMPTTTSSAVSFVVTATDSSVASGGPFSGNGSYSITVSPGAASKLASSAVMATLVSGGNLGTLTVTIEDGNGNTVSNSSAPITVNITGPNGYSQTTTAAAVNGVASLDLSSFALNDAGNYTVASTSTGLTGTSAPVLVSAGAAAKLATSPIPATLVSGGNLGSVTVTVEDVNGNTLTSSSAPVRITITGPNGYFHSVTAEAVNGVATLDLSSLELTTAGSYTVTGTSTGLTGTSTPVVVTAGAAAKLATSAVAATLVSGGNLGSVTGTIEDINGNTVTTSSAPVTITITGPNSYSQTATVAAVNGVATLNLTPVALNDAGNYTVNATSPGLTGTSAPVLVTAGAAAKLASSTVPATLVSGGNLGSLTATIQDVNGNTVTSSTAPVTGTITGPNGYSQAVTAAAGNGVATLNLSSLALNTAGTYTVTGSSPGLTGTKATVNVTPGAASQIIFAGLTPSITSGQNLGTATATVEDANGNVVTSYSGTLTATLAGSNGYSRMVTGTAVDGVATFNLSSLAPTDAGAYTLTLTGPGLTSVSAPPTTISVAPVAQTITLPTIPPLTLGAGSTPLATTTSAGLPITYTVTGPAVLNGSTLTITGAGTVTVTATQAGDSSHSPVVATTTFTVAKAVSTVTLTTSSGVAITGTPVTLTAQIGVPTGIPNGTVTFMDGSTILGTAPVSSGSAKLTLSTLPTGALSLTAAYSGDTNFLTSASPAATTQVQDFGIATTTGSPSVPVIPGQSASFTLSLTPGATGFSSAIALKATGLPPGATYTFSPATVTPGTGTASAVLTIQTAKPVATARNVGGATGIALALLGLPFSLSRRARQAVKRGRLLVLLGGLLLAGSVAGLTGCGTSNGFFGQPGQSYTVTITATSGTLRHATTVVINVQ